MKTLKLAMLTLTATLSLDLMSATSRDLSLAVEDAARETVKALASDSRVSGIKSIAFVRLNLPEGLGKLRLDSNDLQVFEATLASKGESFTFVTHDTHAEEWKLIDGIFDQAADFETYDPKTHPEVKQFKLADALLFGQVIDCMAEETKEKSETSVRMALRLLKVATGEQIWGGVINGKHVQAVEARDVKKEITEDAKELLTFRNILYAAGGLVVLLVLLFFVGRMFRVR